MINNEFLAKITHEFLQLKRSIQQDTNRLGKFKHNADLCPKIKMQFENIFGSFEKYKQITYDIQGIRDNGVDVLFKRMHDDDDLFIGFQIKSNDDLKNSDYLKELKAQYFDATKCFPDLKAYYILLCADISEKSKSIKAKPTKGKNKRIIKNVDKIRNVEAEFSKEAKVFVIEPEYIVTFLRLSLIQIDAIIRSYIGNEDPIYQKALQLVASLTPPEKYVLYYMMREQIYNNKTVMNLSEIENSAELHQIYSNLPDIDRETYFYIDEEEFYEDEDNDIREDDFNSKEEYLEYKYARGLDIKERIRSDFTYLEGNYIYEANENDEYYVDLHELQPLAVFMMEANIRYEYNGSELLNYMIDLFGEVGSFNSSSGENLFS